MRGVTRAQVQKVETGAISTRTPHAGSDVARVDEAGAARISTRTPHAGSDPGQLAQRSVYWNFNPHSPCGE